MHQCKYAHTFSQNATFQMDLWNARIVQAAACVPLAAQQSCLSVCLAGSWCASDVRICLLVGGPHKRTRSDATTTFSAPTGSRRLLHLRCDRSKRRATHGMARSHTRREFASNMASSIQKPPKGAEMQHIPKKYLLDMQTRGIWSQRMFYGYLRGELQRRQMHAWHLMGYVMGIERILDGAITFFCWERFFSPFWCVGGNADLLAGMLLLCCCVHSLSSVTLITHIYCKGCVEYQCRETESGWQLTNISVWTGVYRPDWRIAISICNITIHTNRTSTIYSL